MPGLSRMRGGGEASLPLPGRRSVGPQGELLTAHHACSGRLGYALAMVPSVMTARLHQI